MSIGAHRGFGLSLDEKCPLEKTAFIIVHTDQCDGLM